MSEEKKTIDSLTEWIYSLFSVKSAITSTDDSKNGKITFLTNFGFIVAGKFEALEFDMSSEENITKSIKDHFADNKTVDVLSLGISLHNDILVKSKETLNITNKDKLIHLKDAVIYYYSDVSKPIHLPMMTLFVDQITGTFPAEIEITASK